MLACALTACGPSSDAAPATLIRREAAEDSAFAAHAAALGPLTSITNVSIAPNGEIFVFADGRQVLRLHPHGTPIASAERLGEGPGEWRYVVWAQADASGVNLVDVQLLRLVRLTAALETADQLSIPSLVRGGDVVARLADGRFVSLLEPPLIPGDGRQRFITTLIAWRPGNEAVDTLVTLTGTDMFVDPVEQMYVRIPGGGVDRATGSTTVAVAGNTSEDSLFVVRSGARGRWLPLTGLPRADGLSAPARRAFVDGELLQVPDRADRQRMQRTFDKIERRGSGTRYEQLAIDDRGFPWIGLRSDGTRRVWQVHDSTGAPIEQVVLPSGLRPQVIRGDTLLATVLDDDGSVRLARVVVGPPRSPGDASDR